MEPLLIECELEAAAATVDTERRRIEGLSIPYGEIGVAAVNGEAAQIRYTAGAQITQARERTPLVLSHDNDRPIGVLAELRQEDGGYVTSFAIDATPDGDTALVQAASGSRAGLSGLVRTIDYDENDGVLDIRAGELVHVGLVTIPAFASAQVSRVAAAAADTTPTERSTTVETTAPVIDAPEVTPAAAPETETTIAAERPVILTRASRAGEEIELACSGGELVIAMMLAARGDQNAQRTVEAALSVIDSTDVPGLMPPAYVGSILGEPTTNRPLADRVAVRRPLPATGMSFTKPKWDTLPEGGWVAENAAIPSNAAGIGTQDVTVLEWAWGIAMSYAVATRSSPDAIESLYRAAVASYYRDVEQKIADLLMANDQATAAGAGIGVGIANYFGDVDDAPDLLVVSPDIYGDLVDVADTVPTYSSGSVTGATMQGQIAGLEIVVSPKLPAGTELVTKRGVIELRESSPVRLTANVIGALQVELGVTAFATFDLEIPNGIHSLTPPAGSPSGSARKSEAKRTSGKAKK